MTRRSAWALALLLACACGERPERDPAKLRRSLDSILATAASSSGDVQVKRKDEAYWRPGSIGATYLPGDWARTGHGASERIEFLSGGRLELDEDAVVVIDALEATDAGEAAPLVALQEGSVRGALSRPGATLTLKSKDGARAKLTAASKDVAFSMRDQTVAVERGSAELSTGAGSAKLSANQAFDVARGVAVPLPAIPAALDPGDGARFLFHPDVPVTLAWGAVAGAQRYRVQVARDAAFEDLAHDGTADKPEVLFTAKTPGTYFWRARAEASGGREGGFSGAARIDFDPPPPKDLLVAPAAGEVVATPKPSAPVRFAWQPVGGASSYRLLVAKGRLFGKPVADVQLPETARVLEISLGEYQWAVWANVGGHPQPIFLEGRALSVVKRGKNPIKVPKKIKNWGE